MVSTLGFAEPQYDTIATWPSCWGGVQTDEITATFNAFGKLGTTFWAWDPCPVKCVATELSCFNFESPPGSGHDYLFGGGIWVGGRIGSDTLVSVGWGGWGLANEFTPVDGHDGLYAGVTRAEGISDYALRTQFTDTTRPPDGSQFHPLGLDLVMRSHVWYASTANKAVLHDLIITNIYEDTIHEGYFGLLLDADIGESTFGDEALDDLTGSIRNLGLGYIVDNDGDPRYGEFTAESRRRCMAARFLAESFEATDTSYNWWASNIVSTDDYGPQISDSLFRPFDHGGTGTPTKDWEYYYLMAKTEWDFDQIYLRHRDSLTEPWLGTNATDEGDISNGTDTRFLLSIGPFDLAPDSSVRIIFVTFTGANIHQDPQIMDFLPYYPDFYRWSLDFNDLISVAHVAEGLADSLLSARAPVSGLAVTRNDTGAAEISWDPYVFPGLDGYDLYLTELDSTRLPYQGTLAPWLQPDTLVSWRSVPPVHNWPIDTALNSERFYFANVAHKRADTIGDPGRSVVFRPVERASAPQVLADAVFYAAGDTVRIPFVDSSDNTHQFNVYLLPRFADTASLYHPFYDLDDDADNRVPVDSIEVEGTVWYYYAMSPDMIIDGSDSILELVSPPDSSIVVISAVSDGGFESQFSSPIRMLQAPARTRDVLVMTRSSATNFQAYPDSIRSFYDQALSGLDYDIFYLADSSAYSHYSPWWYTQMPYRLVIIDDDLADRALLLASLARMENYVLSGGQLLVCGSLYEHSAAAYTSRTHGWYRADSLANRLLGIDSVWAIGLRFYHDSTAPPYVDSLGGFVEAKPDTGFGPFLYLDLNRDPFTDCVHSYWPYGTAPLAAAFVPLPGTAVEMMYDTRHASTSEAHGRPVVVSRTHGPGKLMTAGVHLWYLNPVGVRLWIDALLQEVPTAVEPEVEMSLPDRFSLLQNYPNPFNPVTTIEFTLPSGGQVELEVYNILGQLVDCLVDGFRPAGRYTVPWVGAKYSSGVYFYRLRTESGTLSRKMLLLK